MKLLILMAAACTGIAFYNLACAFKDIPTVKASRMMLNVSREKETLNKNLFHVYLDKAALALSPLLRLDTIKREKLALRGGPIKQYNNVFGKRHE